MEEKKKLEIQKKFMNFHKTLLVLITIFCLIRKMEDSELFVWVPILLIFGIVIVETIFKNVLLKSPPVLVVWRYIGIAICFCLMYFSDDLMNLILFCCLFFLMSWEYFFACYMETGINLNLYIGMIGGFAEGLVIVLQAFSQFANSHVLSKVVLFAVLVLIQAVCVSMFERMCSEKSDEIILLNRQIDTLGETNEELQSNQDKIKKANEMLGIQKIQLEAANKQVRNINMEMGIQNEVLRHINTVMDIRELMENITDLLMAEVNLTFCAIVIFPGILENKEPYISLKTQDDERMFQMLREVIEEGRMEPFVHNQDIYVDNFVNSNKYQINFEGVAGSLLMASMSKGGTKKGYLLVGNDKNNFFQESDNFYKAISQQFLIAMENSSLYYKMEQMAIHDGLTGIYNRRHLMELFQKCRSEAKRDHTSLSVALFDIDHFKLINDTYGHLFGDVVIKTIASLAQEVAKHYNGIAGRYGGEEFVLIFPGKNVEEALVPVNNLRDRVKTLVLNHNGKDVSVNVSAGITSYPEICDNPDELLNRADWAMYSSKQNGRDKITVDSDEILQSVKME